MERIFNIRSIKRHDIANAVRYILLACVILYASFAPFSSTSKNLSAQGAILIVMGGLALIGVILDLSVFAKIPKVFLLVIALYLIGLVVTSVFVPDKQTLFGVRFLRLGTLGLASCVIIGFFMRGVSSKVLLITIYASSVLLAVTSLMLGWLRYDYVIRLIGPFYQADALAAYLAVGLLVGLTLMVLYRTKLWLLLGAQILLTISLLFTETRAAIYLVLILGALLLIKLKPDKQVAKSVSAVAVLFGLLFIIGIISNTQLTGRISNVDYARQGVTYRYDLQLAAIRMIPSIPLYGAGPGNAPQVLSCDRLTAPPRQIAPSLQQTCDEHYSFGSSHNVFIDGYLDLGLGGIAYLAMVLSAVGFGLIEYNKLSRTRLTFLAAAVLISLYYLSNVTVPSLELLFLICLFRLVPEKALR